MTTSKITITLLLAMLFLWACGDDDSGDDAADGDRDATSEADTDESGAEGDGDMEKDSDSQHDADTDPDIEAEADKEIEADIEVCENTKGIAEDAVGRSIEYMEENGLRMKGCVWPPQEEEKLAGLREDGDAEMELEKDAEGPEYCLSYEDCDTGGMCTYIYPYEDRVCFYPEDCTSNNDCTSKPNGYCITDSESRKLCVYDQCKQDADCTENNYGVCVTTPAYPRRGLVCMYHDCQQDSECGEDQVCYCSSYNTTWDKDNPSIAYCADSCKSSDECGEGHLCITDGKPGHPSLGAKGFHCTSDEDECGCCNYEDWEVCVYDSEAGHFTCMGLPEPN